MIRIFDDEKLKENPCDECEEKIKGRDVPCLLNAECDALTYYNGQQSILSKAVEIERLKKPTDYDSLWYFNGIYEDKNVELICIPCDNNAGCQEVAHKYFNTWIPTTWTLGVRYLNYSEMEGDWIKIIDFSQYLQEQLGGK